ncbi:MAG: general secretion pathway protein A [Desulfobacteraceae bacterium Eth-SRB2]|nr:MAG: general secretion pathway protein A [Desulfobacteraceae bacterium Eth-SRB2]
MIYQAFFKLNDTPFRLTPDVDYFFSNGGHGEALETLLYSIRSSEGFVQITGRPGVGKTILVRRLLNQLGKKVKTALILHPRLNAEDLLKVILEDLGVPSDVIQNNTKEGLLRFFRKHLVETGRQGCTTVVIVDEAQEIPEDTLEELRLLSNLETEKKKLLSIILVGQTELEKKLNRRSLKQLHQRITIRYRIEPFTRNETVAYILHRLAIAGAAGNIIFPKRVLHAIHRKSAGIPRRINIICERTLMAACVQGVHRINNSHLKRAVESYLGTARGLNRTRYVLLTAFFIVVVLIGGVWWAFFPNLPESLALYGKAPDRFNNSPTRNSGAEGQMSTDNRKEEAPLSHVSNTHATPSVDELSAAKELSAVDKISTVPEMSSAGNLERPPVDMLPENWRCLVIHRHLGLGQVWKGHGRSVHPAASFEINDMPLDDGIYILGKDADARHFIFNPHDFAPWHRYQDLAELYWSQFCGDVDLPAIPLIVRSGEGEVLQSHLPETSTEIRNLVKGWASAWRAMNIETYIQYYAPTLIQYRSRRNKPTVLSRKQYYLQKGRLFQKKSFIALQISEPVCIISPANPDTAVAIFSQRYVSNHYMDEGIKTLFLRRIKEGEGAIPAWKIEGRFWIPML